MPNTNEIYIHSKYWYRLRYPTHIDTVLFLAFLMDIADYDFSEDNDGDGDDDEIY